MTCYQALTLLEDYVDKELPADKEVSIREHLTGCASCREEYETTLLLKELLKQHQSPDPGQDYWTETTNLIAARTVESPSAPIKTIAVTDRRMIQRSAFMRSIVSVAASLVVLFTALLLGSGQEQRLARISASEPPIFVSAPLEQVVGTDNTIIVTRDEQVRLARGMLLMGAPGTLGRFLSPFDIAPSSN